MGSFREVFDHRVPEANEARLSQYGPQAPLPPHEAIIPSRCDHRQYHDAMHRRDHVGIRSPPAHTGLSPTFMRPLLRYGSQSPPIPDPVLLSANISREEPFTPQRGRGSELATERYEVRPYHTSIASPVAVDDRLARELRPILVSPSHLSEIRPHRVSDMPGDRRSQPVSPSYYVDLLSPPAVQTSYGSDERLVPVTRDVQRHLSSELPPRISARVMREYYV